MGREKAIKVARPLAPEDVREGMYVSVLRGIAEVPAGFMCEASSSPGRMVRFEYVPEEADPLEVEAICLPYVLVRTVAGRAETLDVRRCRLARLPRGYARRAREALRCGREAQGDA